MDDFPSINTPVVSRRDILAKFNTFTEPSIKLGAKMLLYAEAGVTKVKVVFGRTGPCARPDRACTDGQTIWISEKMNRMPPTLAEMGITVPKWVEPWSVVILHECAHVIMRHSDPSVRELYDEKARELRADLWVARFLQGVEEM